MWLLYGQRQLASSHKFGYPELAAISCPATSLLERREVALQPVPPATHMVEEVVHPHSTLKEAMDDATLRFLRLLPQLL